MRRLQVRDFKTCLSFDGATNTTVDVGSAIDLTGNCSFCVWINPRNAGGNNVGRICEKLTVSNGYNVLTNATHNLSVALGVGAGQNSVNLFIDWGKWQHIVITYDGANLRYYKNAVLLDTLAYTNNPTAAGANLQIGNRPSDKARGFNGFMDEFTIYDHGVGAVLTQTQIDSIYYSGIYPLLGLKGLWKFDEGVGSTTADSSGNGNTGTITAATFSTNVVMVPRLVV